MGDLGCICRFKGIVLAGMRGETTGCGVGRRAGIYYKYKGVVWAGMRGDIAALTV